MRIMLVHVAIWHIKTDAPSNIKPLLVWKYGNCKKICLVCEKISIIAVVLVVGFMLDESYEIDFWKPTNGKYTEYQ